MKKTYFMLLLLLPLCSQGQIYYPNGVVYDSTTFTFSAGNSLTHTMALPGFYSGDSTIISIDTASTTLWQIGKTLKPVFSNDTTAINGIMTDTLHPYPRDANDFFILKVEYSLPNVIFDIWHKYETDSFHAGGIIEFSLDTGLTWLNIASCSNINTENFYSPMDTIISGDAAFSGVSNGEKLSRFQFMNCWIVGPPTSCSGVSNTYEDPIYIRFRFVSDSAIDSLSGWIIDSIKIENPGCVPGYVPLVSNRNTISLYPNPAQNELTIESGSEAISEVMITNVVGQTQYQKVPAVNCKLLTIDVADLPPGMYLVRINGTEVRKFVKE